MAKNKDQNPTPEEPNGDELKSFLDKVLGGDKDQEEFFGALENNPMLEAWVSFHEMYLGLQSGGFTKGEALQLMARYLYLSVSGEDGTP